jgi:hypothetical protein
MSWDGSKTGGYGKHPKEDPTKDSPYKNLSADDKKRVERRMRVQQIKNFRVDEEKSLAKKLIEWVRKHNADHR